MQSTLTENAKTFAVIFPGHSSALNERNLCKWPLFGCFQTSLHPPLSLGCVSLSPHGLVTSLPDQKSEKPGCSPGLIDKNGCARRSNDWLMLSNVIYTQQKYLRHLSLVYFLSRAMTETFLTSPTTLCLKLITPFKSCVAEDDFQEFASQTPIIYITSSKRTCFKCCVAQTRSKS